MVSVWYPDTVAIFLEGRMRGMLKIFVFFGLGLKSPNQNLKNKSAYQLLFLMYSAA